MPMNRSLHVLPMALLVALAGCLGDVGDATAGPDGVGDALAPRAPVVETLEGEVFLGLATPIISFNQGDAERGEFSFPLPVPSGDITGYVIELEWSAETPLSERLDVWVRDAAQGAIPPEDPANDVPPDPPVATAQGTSPLRIELTVDQLDEGRAHNILVRANSDPAGVALVQPFTLHVATFVDSPFDPSHSALMDDGHDHGHR